MIPQSKSLFSKLRFKIVPIFLRSVQNYSFYLISDTFMWSIYAIKTNYCWVNWKIISHFSFRPPVSSPYSLPPASDSVSTKRGSLAGGPGGPPPPGPGGGPVPSAGMLRPSYPGGVPYPPRPGEAGGVRYAVYPPGGQPGQAQPTQYTQRDGQVFVRQPPVSDDCLIISRTTSGWWSRTHDRLATNRVWY